MESKVSNRRLVNIGLNLTVGNATTPYEFQADLGLDFTPDEVVVRNVNMVYDVSDPSGGVYVLRSSIVDNRDLCLMPNALASSPQVRHNLRQQIRGNQLFKLYNMDGTAINFPNGNRTVCAVSLEFIKY